MARKMRAVEPLSTEELIDLPKNKIEYRHVPTKCVVPDPRQPRQHFSQTELESLGKSLLQRGIYEPIKVRKIGMNKYQIVDGERRWRAARQVKAREVYIGIIDVAEHDCFERSFEMNFNRAEMTEIETAEALQKMLDRKIPISQLAIMAGRSDVWIYQQLKYLKLHPRFRKMLIARKLKPSVGIELSSYPLDQQEKIYNVLQRRLKKIETPMSQQDLHRLVVQVAEELSVERNVPKKNGPSLPYNQLAVRGALSATDRLRVLLQIEFSVMDKERLRTVPRDQVTKLYFRLNEVRLLIDKTKARLEHFVDM